MRTSPYTFCLYRGDRLLTNCYGAWSGAPVAGEVLNGRAETRESAIERIAALRARVTVADSAILWHRGRAVRL